MSRMSADANNIRLDDAVLAELEAAAKLQQKTVDQLAAEYIRQSLQSTRLTRVQAIIAKGKQHGAKSGIAEDQVVDVIHAERLKRSR